VHTRLLVTYRLATASHLGILLLGLLLVACGSRSELLPGSLEAPPGDAGPDEDAEPEPEPDAEPPPEPIRCDDLSFDYSTDPATVLLLVDRSGSMAFGFGGNTRWNLVRDAFFNEQDGLLARLGDTARFGLAFYTSLDGFAGGTCPMMDYTAPVLGDPEVLRFAFDSTSPLTDGDTPTGEAIVEALDWLDQDSAPGPRYLVLITDGEPDTCAVPDPQEGQGEALEAARQAYQRGIEMYVVGVSSDVGESHLQRMANVAQGVREDAVWGQDSEAIEPIVASNQDDVLAAQIQGALGDVRTCSLALGADVDLDGAFVVTLDGERVPPSEYDVEGGQLVLYGETCDRVLQDAETLEVEVPCLVMR